MKITGLLLVLAVAGLYGCSDNKDTAGGDETTSLLEKASQSDIGRITTESLDQATDKIGEAVESVKQTGSGAIESVVDKSGSMTASMTKTMLGEDKAVEESQQLVSSETQVQADKAGAELAAVADSGQAVVDQASDNVENAPTVAGNTVESASLEAAVVGDSFDPEQLAIGKTIYSKHCMACHAAGVAGAPKLSDAAVWEPRVAQGMDTLYGHAINGFKGTAGYMPPKGGFKNLNDDEVKAAVTYMVTASQ